MFGTVSSNVKKWENDGCMPRREKVVKIADKFGVTVEWILHGIDTPNHSAAPITAENLFPRFGQLSNERQNQVLGYMKTLVGKGVDSNAD